MNNKQQPTHGEAAMSKITTQQRLDNERKNWIDRSKALYLAKERMKREGYIYPSSIGKTVLEHHDAVLEYSSRESSYMLEFLKQPSGPRPVESYPARSDECFNAKPEWQKKYE